MNKKKYHIPGERKASILIIMLGKEANKILSRLSKKERETLLRNIKSLGIIKDVEKRIVLREFIAHMNYLEKVRKYNFSLILRTSLFLFFIFLGSVLFLIIYKNASYQILEDIKKISYLLIGSGGIYIFILPFLNNYIRKKYKKTILSFGYTTKTPLKDITLGITAGILGAIILLEMNLKREALEIPFNGSLKFFYIFTIILIVPITEEIIFRGIFYSHIESKYNSHLAVILSTILFTFVHLPENPSEIVQFLIISFILSALRKLCSNLIPSTIAHTIANLSTIFSI